MNGTSNTVTFTTAIPVDETVYRMTKCTTANSFTNEIDYTRRDSRKFYHRILL